MIRMVMTNIWRYIKTKKSTSMLLTILKQIPTDDNDSDDMWSTALRVGSLALSGTEWIKGTWRLLCGGILAMISVGHDRSVLGESGNETPAILREI